MLKFVAHLLFRLKSRFSLACAVFALSASCCFGQTLTVLYDFGARANDGVAPQADELFFQKRLSLFQNPARRSCSPCWKQAPKRCSAPEGGDRIAGGSPNLSIAGE